MPETPDPDVTRVQLRLPASTAYVSLARSAAAAIAARLDYPVDRIDDLRLAVDEACALVITDAAEGSEIACDFSAAGDRLDVQIAGTSRSGATPSHGSFAWMVLSALVDAVDASVTDDHRLVVTLSMHTLQPTHSDEPA